MKYETLKEILSLRIIQIIKMRKISILIIFIFCLISFTHRAQNSNRQPTISSDKSKISYLSTGCNFNNDVKSSNSIAIYPSSERCTYIIKKILSFSGLNSNFEIYRAEIDNAVATIIDNRRIILYDSNLLNFSDYASNSYWTSISILAHEIGHHLSGHTLKSNSRDSHKYELEADKFSGFVLYKMGATLPEAQKAIELLGSSYDTESHPSKSKRLKEIKNGWMEANNQKYESAVPPPPDNDDRFFSISEFNYDEITSDYFQEMILQYNRLDYNKGYLEGIIIDVEKIDGRDYAHTSLYNDNIRLNIQLTKSTRPQSTVNDKNVGERDYFHMIGYRNASNMTMDKLDAILVPGRKIRFKSYYYGYGYEDIYYIKKLNRNETSQSNERLAQTSYIKNSNITANDVITSFLVAEEERNLDVISRYYSSYLRRYYNLQNPTHQDLKDRYKKAWSNSLSSINNIQYISKVSNSIYDLKTEFIFVKNNGERKSVISKVRFVFDNDMKIIETYNL